MKAIRCLLITSLVVATVLPGLRAQSNPNVGPAAIEALNKMGAYLRSIKTFQVVADITDEDVLDNGQKTQSTRTTTILASLPNRAFATVVGNDEDRMMFYDGKTFSLYGRLVGYYATVDAPPTIRELAKAAYEKYQIQFPLEDLFLWGTDKVDTSNITSAVDAGPATVGGVTCEQYAFRQEGLDWLIFIQLGEFPLPKKMVLTTTTDEARPQYTSILTWNLAPSFNDQTFTFVPPSDAHRIQFAAAKPDGK